MSTVKNPVVHSTSPSPRSVRNIGLIWARCLKNSFADRASYRIDFFLGLVVTVLFEFITPLVTILIYQSSNDTGFPGWGLWEALLIQAIFLTSRGVAFTFFNPLIWSVNSLVRSGNFELMLLKPRSSLLVCMSRSINLQSLGRLAGGVVLLGLALGHLPSPGIQDWLLFGVLMILSLLVLFSFALIMAATLFVWVGNGRLSELMESIYQFAQYPLNIFSAGLQLLLCVVLPVAMIAWFPALALLGRMEGTQALTQLWAPGLSCLVLFALGLGLWNHMIQRYSGAGG